MAPLGIGKLNPQPLNKKLLLNKKCPSHLHRESKLPCPPSLTSSPLHTSYLLILHFLILKKARKEKKGKKKYPESLCASFLYLWLSKEQAVAHSLIPVCTPPLRGLPCFYKLPRALWYHHTVSDCQEAIPKIQLRGFKGCECSQGRSALIAWSGEDTAIARRASNENSLGACASCIYGQVWQCIKYTFKIPIYEQVENILLNL